MRIRCLFLTIQMHMSFESGSENSILEKEEPKLLGNGKFNIWLGLLMYFFSLGIIRLLVEKL